MGKPHISPCLYWTLASNFNYCWNAIYCLHWIPRCWVFYKPQTRGVLSPRVEGEYGEVGKHKIMMKHHNKYQFQSMRTFSKFSPSIKPHGTCEETFNFIFQFMELFSSNSTSQRPWKSALAWPLYTCLGKGIEPKIPALWWIINPGSHRQLGLMNSWVAQGLGWPCPDFLCSHASSMLNTAQPDWLIQPSCTIIMYKQDLWSGTLTSCKAEFSDKEAEQTITIQTGLLWSWGNWGCFLTDKIPPPFLCELCKLLRDLSGSFKL